MGFGRGRRRRDAGRNDAVIVETVEALTLLASCEFRVISRGALCKVSARGCWGALATEDAWNLVERRKTSRGGR